MLKEEDACWGALSCWFEEKIWSGFYLMLWCLHTSLLNLFFLFGRFLCGFSLYSSPFVFTFLK